MTASSRDGAPQGGDSQNRELQVFYREQGLALIRLAFLLTGSRETAEDIAQIAFAQLASRWETVDEPVGYLRRIVVNQANDSHRRAYRRARPVRDVVETAIPDVDETWPLIADLPPAQRAVIVLRFYQDLPLTEIAEILGRRQSTVRSDLRRGLARLRTVLHEVGPGQAPVDSATRNEARS